MVQNIFENYLKKKKNKKKEKKNEKRRQKKKTNLQSVKVRGSVRLVDICAIFLSSLSKFLFIIHFYFS